MSALPSWIPALKTKLSHCEETQTSPHADQNGDIKSQSDISANNQHLDYTYARPIYPWAKLEEKLTGKLTAKEILFLSLKCPG